MKLLTLFFSFLQIGAFSFGGGYAALPLIQHQVVDLYHWLTMNELTDLIMISQMTPGPIAINAATFVGLKIDSFYGAIVATLGCILPSCIIVSLIAYIYLKYQQMSIIQNILKYIRPAVVSLIAVSGLLIIVSIRRMHDIGKSGWWLFITFVPVIGSLWYLFLTIQDGQPGSNQYGENPKGI